MTAPATLVPATAEQRQAKVADHIRNAAETTGVPFDFLLAQANQESRLDPNARNRRSSAQGLFQFTKGTWLEMVKKHGAEHGLGKYAEAITRGKNGWTVADTALKAEILDLRRDPKLSATMAAEYAKDNQEVLETRLGRAVSAHDLYMAHFLGASGAARVLEGVADAPRQSAAGALPDAARANPEVFHERGGKRRSVAALHDMLKKRFDRALKDVAPLAQRSNSQSLAALRPESRPAPEYQFDFEQVAALPATVPEPDPAPNWGTYPVTLPPPVSTNVRAGGPVLRILLKAMEDDGAV